jgi:hypothetical protein
MGGREIEKTGERRGRVGENTRLIFSNQKVYND